MTDYTPDAPLQMADVQWSTVVAVSMTLTGAPGIVAPCGHLLQPYEMIVTFARGTVDPQTLDWDVEGWDIMVIHPDDGKGLGATDLTLTQKDFGEGSVMVTIPDAPEGFEGLAALMGLDGPQKKTLLGPVPEWVHTAIKSYQPYVTGDIPVRTAPTYHG